MESAAYLFGRPEAQLDLGTGASDVLFAAQRAEEQVSGKVTFRHCTFANISFLASVLEGVTFENCVFLECYFRDASFKDCTFKACKFLGCDLRKLSITGCDFRFYNEFDGCTLPYGELSSSLPSEPNLKAHLCENLAEQSRLAGEVRDAGRYRRAAARAQGEHLRSATFGSSTWYRTKYRGLDRLNAGLQLASLRVRGLLWGHAHPFWVVLRNWVIVSLVAFPILFILVIDGITIAGRPAEWSDAWLISVMQVLPGARVADVLFASGVSRTLAILESVAGLIFAGITVSLLFRAVSERWRT